MNRGHCCHAVSVILLLTAGACGKIGKGDANSGAPEFGCRSPISFRNYTALSDTAGCRLLGLAIDSILARPETDPFFALVRLEEITHARLDDGGGEINSVGPTLSVSIRLPERPVDASVDFDSRHRVVTIRPIPKEGDLFDVWDEWARLRPRDSH